MRALLLSLSLALASSAALARDAAACGTVRQLQLETAMSPTGTFAFVVIDGKVPADVKWQRLWPRSFEYTQTAAAPALAAPVYVRLVGKTKSRNVTTARRVYVKLHNGETHVALQIPLEHGEWFERAMMFA